MNALSPSRVLRSKKEARSVYTRRARWYDIVEGRWERAAREMGVRALRVQPGERVLEIGPGTGAALLALAERVGAQGRVFGLDLAEGMLAAAQSRLRRAGRPARVSLIQGDGAYLPFGAGAVDAVFMSFTLELFDTPEIPQVLSECGRILRRGGRLGTVSLSLSTRPSLAAALYEWGHRLLPRLFDCRPIPAPEMLEEAGFADVATRKISLFGLPVVVAVGRAP